MAKKNTKPAPRRKSSAHAKRAVRDLSPRKSALSVRGGAGDKVEAGSENVRRVKS